MASQCCWSCLSKLRPSRGPLFPSAPALRAHFSSTTARNAMPPKKKPFQSDGPKFRVPTSAGAKSKTKPARQPRFTPDEIRANQRPVALSNPNAIEVPGLQALSVEHVVDETSRGKVFALPPQFLEQLRSLGVFKPSQSWGLFKKPATLVRAETLELGKLVRGIGGAEEGEMKGKSVTRIVSGLRNVGKTTHLLQALTLGLMNEWVVMHVPNARAYVCGSTAYAPLPNTDPVEYTQNDATASLLRTIADANRSVLSRLYISQDHGALNKAISKTSTLHTLALLGAGSPENAWPVFQALWKELTATSADPNIQGIEPFKPRPPMLVAIDGLAHWMTNSAYMSPQFKPIHAHDFSLIKHFLSLATTRNALPNGGIALYATSTCNNPLSPALDVSLKQLAARQAGIQPSSSEFPLPDPYAKLDSRAMEYFNAVMNGGNQLGVQELKGVSKDDTRGLLEYYALSGLMRERISEEVVGEKWSLAGGGIVGELHRFGKRIRAVN